MDTIALHRLAWAEIPIEYLDMRRIRRCDGGPLLLALLPGDIMTRKPVTQGDEDGLCGLYSLVNALGLLYPTIDQKTRDHIFKDAALACHAGIKILWQGTTYMDVRFMLNAAQTVMKAARHPFTWEQPFRRQYFANFDEFQRELKWRIAGDDAFAIVGISKPWSHWTCAHRLTQHMMIMTDSCHVKQIPLAKCGLAGDGTDYEFDYRQTFTLMKTAK